MPLAIIKNNIVEIVDYVSSMEHAKKMYPDYEIVEAETVYAKQIWNGSIFTTPEDIEHDRFVANRDVDMKTDVLIREGLAYDGHVFSLSMNAQINWTALYSAINAGLISLPYDVSTMDNKTYTIINMTFFTEILNIVSTQLALGRALKSQINVSDDPLSIKDLR